MRINGRPSRMRSHFVSVRASSRAKHLCHIQRANHVCPLRVMTIEMRQNVAAINLHFCRRRPSSSKYSLALVLLYFYLRSLARFALNDRHHSFILHPARALSRPRSGRRLPKITPPRANIYFMIKKVAAAVLKFGLIRSPPGLTHDELIFMRSCRTFRQRAAYRIHANAIHFLPFFLCQAGAQHDTLQS